MTSPFPAVTPGPLMQDPGIGPSIQQGLAGVLAQMQIDRENQFRQQELANAQAQQQALQQYYQALAQAEQQRLAAEAGEQAKIREGQRQVGATQRTFLMAQANQGLPSQILGSGALAMPPRSSLPSIFTGVSDENLPAAVEGVQKVQGLTPKPPELPTSAQEFMFRQYLQQADPSGGLARGYDLWHRAPQQPLVQNIIGAGEQQFDKSYAEIQAKEIGVAQNAAIKAAAASSGLDEAYNLVKKNKVYTGLFANQKLNLARMANALGANPDETKAANTQELMKLTGDQVLALMATRVLGANNAVSDADLRFANLQSGRDITVEPLALRKTLRIMKGTGMVMQQDAIDLYRDQAKYSSKAASQQLNGRANAMEEKLGKQWSEYAKMLQDEGETAEQIIQRMPPRLAELYGPQIQEEFRKRQIPFSVKATGQSFGFDKPWNGR